MTLLSVLHFPDKRLRIVAKPVNKITSEIKQTTKDMLETMYKEHGIGLAAIQVNIHKRIIVIDVSKEGDQPIVLINPLITTQSGEEESEEGCLSVPETKANIKRSEFVTVQFIDLEGKDKEIQADGLLAICIQHELDHLEGRLFIDYLSKLKQKRIYTRLEKNQRINQNLKE
ncbi:MAG: peptide deformylase [Psychromonas sp.]|nr:peptide deformylase [Psychromonas sp.]